MCTLKDILCLLLSDCPHQRGKKKTTGTSSNTKDGLCLCFPDERPLLVEQTVLHPNEKGRSSLTLLQHRNWVYGGIDCDTKGCTSRLLPSVITVACLGFLKQPQSFPNLNHLRALEQTVDIHMLIFYKIDMVNREMLPSVLLQAQN